MKTPITIASCLLLALTFTAAAQNAEIQDLAKQWTSLRDAMLNVEKAMPDDKYSFRPSPHAPSFAELLLKMVNDIESTCGDLLGYKAGVAQPETLDADTMKKLVGQSFECGAKMIAGLKETNLGRTRGTVLAALMETAETRGQAETYLKAKDMVTAEEADRRKFLFYGFLAAWLLVCLYVVAISLRERRLRGELDRVKRLIENREPGQPEQVRL